MDNPRVSFTKGVDCTKKVLVHWIPDSEFRASLGGPNRFTQNAHCTAHVPTYPNSPTTPTLEA